MISRICAAAFPNRPDSCVHVEQKTLTLDRVGFMISIARVMTCTATLFSLSVFSFSGAVAQEIIQPQSLESDMAHELAHPSMPDVSRNDVEGLVCNHSCPNDPESSGRVRISGPVRVETLTLDKFTKGTVAEAGGRRLEVCALNANEDDSYSFQFTLTCQSDDIIHVPDQIAAFDETGKALQ